MKKDTQEVVETVSGFVNSFSSRGEDFCNLMSHEHRTLQQSFTKLCFQWIEKVASDDYLTDGRNEQSKEIAKSILKSQAGEDFGGKPSEFLRMI